MAELIEIPGANPINEGERRVVQALCRELPATYTVVPNVEVPDRNAQWLEYDAIVVAPHAVYMVETKDWHGEISGDEYEWLVRGRSVKSPLRLAVYKSKVLKSKLVEKDFGLKRAWVEPAVCLASEPQRLSLVHDVAKRVFLIDEISDFIIDPQEVQQKPNAIADLTDRVINALLPQLRARSGRRVFGSYEVLELLEQGEDEAIYRARSRLFPDMPPVRLRVVTLSPYLLSPAELETRRKQVLRETEALLKIGVHPNIVPAREVFTEDDDHQIILIEDTINGPTLRQVLRDGTPLTLEQQIGTLIDIVQALKHAHAHGVIHRHISPSAIIFDETGGARLGDFSLAKLMDYGSTVWSTSVFSDAEIDERYLAPELRSPTIGPVSAATDIYELGCVVFEMLAGRPAYDSPAASFGQPPSLPSALPSELNVLVQSMIRGNPQQRPTDAASVLEKIRSIVEGRITDGGTEMKTRYDVGDLIAGQFEVKQVLGDGGFGSVYRVYAPIQDREFAVKIFHGRVALDIVQREFKMLESVAKTNSHIVQPVFAGLIGTAQFYLATELVIGETLEAYAYAPSPGLPQQTQGKWLSAEQARDLICQLLSALETFHPQTHRIEELKRKSDAGDFTAEEWDEFLELQGGGIVHRDISPQNLIWSANGIVLIDFNIASKVGEKVRTMAAKLRYRDPDVQSGLDTWNALPDLLATGIVLYELLCHEHPYISGEPHVQLSPRDPREFRRELSSELAAFLARACMPYQADRFQSARDMRLALEAIDPLLTTETNTDDEVEESILSQRLRLLLENHPQNVNPMVREFLALSSQARRSNRGTRGMDDLAHATYVQTDLDKDLSESLLAGRHRLVIVTGNAGDGKTAFIQQVERECRRRGASGTTTANGSRLQLDGMEILTLYDGSQDEENQSSDDILDSFFTPFRSSGTRDRTVRLAAINEGRLRDFLLGHRATFPKLAADIIAALDEPANVDLGEEIVVVNLNLRSITAGSENSIFTRQLQAIVNGPFWKPCESCDYRTQCPLKYNVDTFRDATSGPAATERLRTLVDLVRLRRQRHLTMRDVRSMLSHILFRDRVCEEIPQILASGDSFDVIDGTYFQAPGGLGVPPGSALERNTELLTVIDVAYVSNPNLDRALARGEGPRVMAFPTRSSDYPDVLLTEMRERAGGGYDSDPTLAQRVHAAMRRRAYFERSDDGWIDMLPYERLREFQAALIPENKGGRDQLLRTTLAAISMYEGLVNANLVEDALWLATNDEEGFDFRGFRRFPHEDFLIRVVTVPAPYMEAEPDRLELIHEPSGARLDIDIDLHEVLDRLRDGYVPSAEESQGFLLNLGIFKNRLLHEESREMLLADERSLFSIALASPGSIVLKEVIP